MSDSNTVTPEDTSKSNILVSRIKIGGTIRAIREKRGFSQEQLAEKMSISRSTISKIETGKFNCSIDYLSKFASFLDFEIILQDSQQTL